MREIDSGQAYRALLNDPSECGDVGLVERFDQTYLIALIDGLGHGSLARHAALLARDYIVQNHSLPVADIMRGMHKHLAGSRGGVAAICTLDIPSGQLTYVGIGNITTRLINSDYIKLVPKDGVIGFSMGTPVAHTYKMSPNGLLLMFSDGVRGHFVNENKWEWRGRSAQDIADEVIQVYSTSTDDASCLVIRYI